MTNVSNVHAGRKPEVVGDRPSDAISRNVSMARGELVHPAVTPLEDVPRPPSSLRPLPCPDGYAPTPAVFRTWRLSGANWSLAHFLADQVVINGQPCYFARPHELVPKIMAAIGRSKRAVELGLDYFAERGAITMNRRLFRGEEYSFVWINWALRDDLPEFGQGPDRDDPDCDEPHRPAFLLPGHRLVAGPGAGSCAIEAREAGAGSCAGPDDGPDGAKSCATEAADLQGVAPADPPISDPCANVNVLSSSSSGLNPETLTSAPVAQNPAPEPTGYEGMSDAEVYAALAPKHVFVSAPFYSGPLRELAARSLPIPERYRGKPLWRPTTRPEPEVRRYAPPPPDPAKPAPPATLEQRIRKLHKSGDLTEADELAAWMFRTVGERDNNPISARFHRRNMAEVAAGDMPPGLLIGELKSFREGKAENPLKALTTNIRNWRADHGLDSGKVDRRRKPNPRPGARESRAGAPRSSPPGPASSGPAFSKASRIQS